MISPESPDYRERTLGWLVMVACAFTAVAVLLLHLLQPALDPASQAISEYVHGRHGFLMTMTFYSQALASLALAAILLGRGVGLPRGRIGAVLFITSAIGAVVAGVYPADLGSRVPQTSAGTLHTAGGLARFLALAIALPLLSRVLAEIQDSPTAARVLKSLAWLFVVVFVVSILLLANLDLFGLGQRVFILILLVWMCLAVLPTIRAST